MSIKSEAPGASPGPAGTQQQDMSHVPQLALDLLVWGIPVVVVTPGDVPPPRWPALTAEQAARDIHRYRPGTDALAMVCGHGLDVVDLDAKMGAKPSDLPAFTHYGIHRTPSGGWHFLVPSTGFRKGSLKDASGRVLGDYCGGNRNGAGRLLCFLPGSTRSKYPDGGYAVEQPWDLDAALDSSPDDELLTILFRSGLSMDGESGRAPASSEELKAFTAEHSQVSTCPYGSRALDGMLAASRDVTEGGRHQWAIRCALRVVELVRSGCLDLRAVAAIRDRLAELKPEGGTDWDALLAYAVANTEPATGCQVHGKGPGTAQGSPEDGQVDPEPSSWEPQPLDDVLDGTFTPEVPELLPRTDGACLIYRGRVHSFHGESESGKSFLLQAEAARVLGDGGRVLFLDFESDRESVVSRLLAFGAAREDIRDRFCYVNPDEPITATAAAREAWDRLLSSPWDLVILDGVTDAMNVLGFARDGDVNDQATRFMRAVPKRLASRTGAAVALVDHVTKASDGRGRFAIGAQAKLSGLTGAAFTVEVERALMPGAVGELVLRVGKDRPSGLRQHCSPAFRKTDRTQEAARAVVDSTGPIVTVTLQPPSDLDPGATPFRPTTLMQRVSEYLATCSEPVSAFRVGQDVTGKRTHVLLALRCLVEDGFVSRGEGGHRHVHAYAVGDVPDPFRGTESLRTAPNGSPSGTRSRFPSKGGETGEPEPADHGRFPGTKREPGGNRGTTRAPGAPAMADHLGLVMQPCEVCGMPALTSPCSTCRAIAKAGA